MSVAAEKLLDYGEYLALEQELGRKLEYVDGVVTARTGGTIAHALLVAAVAAELRSALKGTPCRVHSSEQRVRVARGRAYYPDASVTSGPIPVDPDDPHAIVDARVVVEVLSRTTARYDRVAKATDYRALPSCTSVLLVSADRVCIERWRKDEAGVWRKTIHGPPDRVPLPHDRWMPVTDVYEGVPLDSASRFA